MEYNKEEILSLAEKIYQLDEDVAKILNSSLGRVFGEDRKRAIRTINSILYARQSGYKIRSEIALIGNMARTIPNRKTRAQIMARYNAILNEVMSLPSSFADGDILDPTLAELNLSALENRFGKDDHLIICIGRSCGCGGNEIGFSLADALHINFYDVSVMNEVFRQHDGEEALQAHAALEKESFGSPISWWKNFVKFHGLSEMDELFFETTKLLLEKAKTEDFIVMGRFADAILTNNHIPHVSIFITAPEDRRVQRIVEINESISPKQARHFIQKEDSKHLRRYRFYTGRSWGHADNYDLCINSASYGIQGAVQVLLRMIGRTTANRK